MSVCIYQGGADEVWSSGVGRALEHQAAALKEAGLPLVEKIPPAGPESRACVVHLNTTRPRGPCWLRPGPMPGAARWCTMATAPPRLPGGGSRLDGAAGAPVAGFVLPPGGPGDHPQRLRQPGCWPGIRSAGPSTPSPTASTPGFFRPDAAAGARFRERYCLAEGQQCVISVGHWSARKGLPEFTELARRMPEVRFIWFGRAGEGPPHRRGCRRPWTPPRGTCCLPATSRRTSCGTPTAGQTPLCS